MNEKRWILSLLLAAAVACMDVVNAFVLLQTPPPPPRQPSLFFHQPAHNSPARTTRAARTTTTTTRLFTGTSLPDLASMKASEMREELESYGISTKSFFEKKEFMTALEKARADGKTPKQQKEKQQPADTKSSSRSSTSSSTSSSTKDSSSASSSSSSSSSRDEKIKAEMEKAQKMSVGDLRTKLKELGIKTTTFFEKSEFVRAYAEAMADGVKSAAAAEQEEEFDASYRDVVVQKMNARDPRLLQQGTIIDIKAAPSNSSKR